MSERNQKNDWKTLHRMPVILNQTEVPEGRLCISRSLARTHRQSHSGLIGWSVDGTLIGDDGAIGLWYSRYVQSGPSGLFNGRKLQKKNQEKLVWWKVKSSHETNGHHMTRWHQHLKIRQKNEMTKSLEVVSHTQAHHWAPALTGA